jgi:hypothetical protein
VELDGIPDTLPIIIEEIYSPTDQQSISLPLKSNNDKSVASKTPNSSKKLTASTDNSSSAASSRSKSQQTKMESFSSPIVRQSLTKNFLPFRSRTPTGVIPVGALSTEPFVKLTSYRKVDQNSTSDNTNSNVFSHRSKSTRLTKQPSRLSLPDVPFQRSNSLSTSTVGQLDSPVIPKFLCSTSDKNDDDVFLSNDQGQMVDPSTFGDSSTKSKVLRESYRRKANTEDRRRTKSTMARSLSTSYQTHPKYFITTTDDKPVITTANGPVNYPLDSVLNLTLQLEKTSADDIQRRHTTSSADVDPLLLNGLTDDENHVNLMEKMNGHQPTNEQTENKQDSPPESDRILTNSSINSQTIE